ncbi:hypothetical protein OIU84_010492 [Salix udensis]|uniref:Xylanase inhibitor N-terminal domain-containing protein n=1 Tax=Salix udensis TaxID=889485 RepID=A0AAD6JKV0_9ROSI|nr:hypothetical protein OIU84_010492 [Salix udensis]
MLDPSISSTYESLSCKNTICRYAPSAECDSTSQCVYSQTYVQGLPSAGVIATEQLIFGSSDDGTNAVNNVLFGCSHRNGNYADRRFTGSLCYNQLVFSDGVNMEGYSTPLDVVDGHYQVILEGISVGETRLVIDPGAFKEDREEKKSDN